MCCEIRSLEAVTWHLHAITFISLTLTELVWEILFKVTPNLFVLERSNSINSGACAPLRFLFRSCRLNLCCCSEMQKKNKGYVLLQHLQTGMTTSVTRSNERVHFSFLSPLAAFTVKLSASLSWSLCIQLRYAPSLRSLLHQRSSKPWCPLIFPACRVSEVR